jgi:hypothetical protein
MKKRLYLFLSLVFLACLGLYITTDAYNPPPENWEDVRHALESSGLSTEGPTILSTPAAGSVFRVLFFEKIHFRASRVCPQQTSCGR